MTRVFKESELQGEVFYSWSNEATGESVTAFEPAIKECACEARERLMAYLDLVWEINERIEREKVEAEEDRVDTLGSVEKELGIRENKKEALMDASGFPKLKQDFLF